ncbi:MAG: eCIS core domain-containing protein [Nitrosospira sp.]
MNKSASQIQTRMEAYPLYPSGILQRSCACGNHTVTGETCSECGEKERSLQRKAIRPDSDISLSRSLAMQRKLAIGASNDPLEQEADRVADHVVSAPSNSAIDETPMRMRRFTAQTTRQAETAPASVDYALAGSGEPLERALKEDMEARFGYDFSGVRVHFGATAEQSAREVNANAYTAGHNIVFGAGQFAPGTNEGRRLIAHELAHVVQQAPLSEAASFHTLSLTAGQESSAGREGNQDAVGVVNRKTLAHPVRQRPVILQRAGIPVVEDVLAGVRWAQCWLGKQENPVVNPLADISIFQSPGASGWWGAKFGCYRNNCSRRHRGWDIHAAAGTPIRAVVTGAMTRHNDPGGYGQYVTLASQANPQREYRYAHLSRREPAGDYCVGDKLGETGVTGNAEPDRPHLHFEVRENGTAIDPAPYLTEPNQVIEATGSAIAAIDKTLAPPCNAC